MILDLYKYFRDKERENEQFYERNLWKIVQEDHPNLTDQERKQIFLDCLYQTPTNKEDSNEP
jgi:hypothetical protein